MHLQMNRLLSTSYGSCYEPSIEIHPGIPGADGLPRTLLDSGADFEEEHGVGVLTGGKRVLNLGYSGEA